MDHFHTTNGYDFNRLDYAEAKDLEVGEKICIGIWQDEAHTKLELIPSEVTKAAYYNADCDEPDWEIETNNGVVDLFSLYTMPVN